MVATTATDERLQIIEFRRLLYCMQTNEAPSDQSWQSILLRAQLAQNMWQSVANLEAVKLNTKVHDEFSREVDHACRRAREVAKRKREQEDYCHNLMQRLFFRSAESIAESENCHSQMDVQDFTSTTNQVEEESFTTKDALNQNRINSYSETTTSVDELQKAQREQMEDAIAQMAAQMKQATQNIHTTLRQQTGQLLDEMETVVEQNKQDVTKVVQNVQQHNASSWRSTLGTWTLFFFLVGVFVVCFMTILTVPKRPEACIFFCKSSTDQFLLKHELARRKREDPEPHDEWEKLYQDDQRATLEKEQLALLVKRGLQTNKNNKRDELQGLLDRDKKLRDHLDWKQALGDDESKIFGRLEPKSPEGLEHNPDNDRNAVDDSDPFAARKSVGDKPFTGNQAIEEDDDLFTQRNSVGRHPVEHHKKIHGNQIAMGDANGDANDDPFADRSVYEGDLNQGAYPSADSFRTPTIPIEVHREKFLQQAAQNDFRNPKDSEGNIQREDHQDYQRHGTNTHTSFDAAQQVRSGDFYEAQTIDVPEPPMQKPEDVVDQLIESLSKKAKSVQEHGVVESTHGGEASRFEPTLEPTARVHSMSGDDSFRVEAFSRAGTVKVHFSPRDFRVAAANGDDELLASYLDAKPNYLDRKDKNGWTALHLAVRAGHVRVVQRLIRHGSDVSSITEEGYVPLALALDRLGENHQITQLLRDAGAAIPSAFSGSSDEEESYENYRSEELQINSFRRADDGGREHDEL